MIHHMQSGQLEYPTPLCVVIDEAHQGRTGMGFQEIDSELFLGEDGQGEMFDHEEINSTKQHAEVLQKTCVKSAYAVAVTATHQHRYERIELHSEQHRVGKCILSRS